MFELAACRFYRAYEYGSYGDQAAERQGLSSQELASSFHQRHENGSIKHLFASSFKFAQYPITIFACRSDLR